MERDNRQSVSESPRTTERTCGDDEVVGDLVVPRVMAVGAEQREKLRRWVAEIALRAVRGQGDGDERA
jgi:hypothetical protein